MKNGLPKMDTEKMTDLILKILLALKMAPMVAATYIAIAMRLYKTTLSTEEYKTMVETIMDTEVEPYNPDKKGTLH